MEKVNDLNSAIKIVEAYQALVARAIEIVTIMKYSLIDVDVNVTLTFDEDVVVLTWQCYESDYYGGGSLETEHVKFPASHLFLTNDELTTILYQKQKEEAERQAKVYAAQLAVKKDREESRDRAEYARLKAKYKHGYAQLQAAYEFAEMNSPRVKNEKERP